MAEATREGSRVIWESHGVPWAGAACCWEMQHQRAKASGAENEWMWLAVAASSEVMAASCQRQASTGPSKPMNRCVVGAVGELASAGRNSDKGSSVQISVAAM